MSNLVVNPEPFDLPEQRPLAAKLLPSNFYYGWAIVFACAALMFVSVGVGYYGLAVYLGPLRELHGWSNADVSLATGMYFAFSGISSALIGPQIDKHGARRWMLPGLLLIAVGSLFIGQVTTLWQLYVTYILLAIGSGMSAGVAVNATLARWFVQRRAWAMAMASTGVSLGGAVLSPLNTFLIEQWGLSTATPIMGLLIVVVGVPITIFVLVWDPRQMRLPQDGLNVVKAAATNAARSTANQTRQWTPRQALRTSAFWAILISFVIVLLAQTGFILHQVAFLEERLGSLTAAGSTLSLTAIGSIVARLVVGRFFADRVDLRILTVIMFLVQGTAALAVIHIDHPVSTFVAILIFGFTIGNVYMLQSLLTSDVFGYVSFGAVYGMIALATQLSSGLGPWLIGALEDLTGSYEVPLTVVAILTYAALVPIYFAKPPKDVLRRTVSRAVSVMVTRPAPQRHSAAVSVSRARTRSSTTPHGAPTQPTQDRLRARR